MKKSIHGGALQGCGRVAAEKAAPASPGDSAEAGPLEVAV